MLNSAVWCSVLFLIDLDICPVRLILKQSAYTIPYASEVLLLQSIHLGNLFMYLSSTAKDTVHVSFFFKPFCAVVPGFTGDLSLVFAIRV